MTITPITPSTLDSSVEESNSITDLPTPLTYAVAAFVCGAFAGLVATLVTISVAQRVVLPSSLGLAGGFVLIAYAVAGFVLGGGAAVLPGIRRGRRAQSSALGWDKPVQVAVGTRASLLTGLAIGVLIGAAAPFLVMGLFWLTSDLATRS